MSTVLEFAKQKSISLISSTINGKGCCTAYSTTRKKSKRLPNLGTLRITPRSNALRVRMTTDVKSEEPKKTSPKECPNTDVTEKREFRKNSLNIQMLSKSLHHQIFGDTMRSDQANLELIEKAKEQLKEHGLLGNEISYLKDVELNLPALRGINIEEHFFSIGEEQSKPYRELVNSFIKNGIPNPPNEWLCQKGWTKYVEGKEPVSVPFPDDDILIFDVEVCVRLGELPTLATAVSPNAWYGWVCSDLAEGINSIPKKSYSTNMLIPFEGKTVNKEKPRLIVGHNVSYDRARIREQYYLKNSALCFLDTMALHICIGGINRAQKTKLASGKTLDMEDDIGRELCLCSLKELYSLYCGKELDKEQRNIFVEGLMPDVKNDFQNLIKYCAKDVKATYEVLQVIFPIFLKRFSHPVTLAGMLEMGSGFLPVNQNWNKFLVEAEETYEDLKSEISSILSEKCDNACKLLYNEEFKKDLWMWGEDWTTQALKLTKKKVKPNVTENEDAKKSQGEEEEEDPEEKALQMKYQYLFDLGEVLPKKPPFLPGYPLWYRKLCEKPDSPDWTPSPQLTTSMHITPKLLNLTWENFPLHHTQEYGWGILIPDLFAENVETSIPFEKLKELTIKNFNIDLTELEQEMFNVSGKKGKEISQSRVPYYKGSGIWCNHIVDNCCFFFKIPHKNGGNKNVGNPLSKDIAHVFASGVFSSSDSSAEKVLDLSGKLTYWRNSRHRITSQMVVWLNKKEANVTTGSDEQDTLTGIIIPKVVVCGTLTRRAMENTWLTASRVIKNRIGSELRSMIQAPPGYHFIGADVDSQELWIASLIGDSHYAKVHGSTPLGWMTLSGTKPSGTDMHSVTAKAVGISRDHAKTINYARIYGAGVKFAEKLLKQFNPSMSEEEARRKAIRMYRLTKGIKEFKVKESVLDEFNCMFGPNVKIYDLSSAAALARKWKKKMEDIFEKAQWTNGTESAMFNQLEKIASSSKPVTPFLQCRLSRALEPRYDGDDLHLKTRINWVVQSGAVDFLHLMLVCMKWLTNGKARYCFSFHDEVRYMIPSEERYSGALALHITNLLVRCFCSHRLGIYDLPQSVAFFSSVEIDKSLRKEANDDCVTPSNPYGIEKEYGIGPGESLNIYEAIEKTGGSLSAFGTAKKRASALSSAQSSQKSEEFKTEMSQATKRKHVHREILHGALVPPTENQQIVRVLGSRGSNLHEVETAEATTFLASMPSKFRKNVWIKRGDYILVEPIEEGGKVKAEIVNILTADYIKFLKKENIWPSEFSKQTEEATNSNDDFFVNNNRKPIFSENETLE